MIPSSSDTVLVDTLHLSACIGADCWGKTRAQPLFLSLYLDLEPRYLVASGEADEVEKSVHYGLLTKRVMGLVGGKGKDGESGGGWDGVEELVRGVAEEAFDLGGECVRSVRAVVRIPKFVLLADSFTVDITLSSDYATSTSPHSDSSVSAKSRRGRKVVKKEMKVEGIVVPVVIGVNPPERLAKQKVVTDLAFYERDGEGDYEGEGSMRHVGYRKVVDSLVKDIEASSYLTLEKFVHELARKAFNEEKRIEAVRVRARKPSALTFADFSGVEVTRRRADYGL